MTQSLQLPNLFVYERSRAIWFPQVELKRKRDKAAAVLRQRYRNLELDMTHSFALETVAQAEIGSVKTHNSRSEQAQLTTNVCIPNFTV
eukprot:172130-Pleurochrysis_carterae.AAC.3